MLGSVALVPLSLALGLRGEAASAALPKVLPVLWCRLTSEDAALSLVLKIRFVDTGYQAKAHWPCAIGDSRHAAFSFDHFGIFQRLEGLGFVVLTNTLGAAIFCVGGAWVGTEVCLASSSWWSLEPGSGLSHKSCDDLRAGSLYG